MLTPRLCDATQWARCVRATHPVDLAMVEVVIAAVQVLYDVCHGVTSSPWRKEALQTLQQSAASTPLREQARQALITLLQLGPGVEVQWNTRVVAAPMEKVCTMMDAAFRSKPVVVDGVVYIGDKFQFRVDVNDVQFDHHGGVWLFWSVQRARFWVFGEATESVQIHDGCLVKHAWYTLPVPTLEVQTKHGETYDISLRENTVATRLHIATNEWTMQLFRAFEELPLLYEAALPLLGGFNSKGCWICDRFFPWWQIEQRVVHAAKRELSPENEPRMSFSRTEWTFSVWVMVAKMLIDYPTPRHPSLWVEEDERLLIGSNHPQWIFADTTYYYTCKC